MTLIDTIKQKEGLRLKAYQDEKGVWTIGWGNTYYENGISVKAGDEITLPRAEQLLLNTVRKFTQRVDDLVIVKLNDNQKTALVSLAYNIGLGAFAGSTLLKLVNANPQDAMIRFEFVRWNKIKVWDEKNKKYFYKKSRGLTIRREQEAALYFKPTV